MLWGLSALTNPVVLGVLPFLAGWVCYRLHRQKGNWRVPAATAALTVLITLAPWLIRNYRAFRQPVFLKDGLPLAFTVGNVANAVQWWNPTGDLPGNAAEMAKFQRVGEQAYAVREAGGKYLFCNQQ